MKAAINAEEVQLFCSCACEIEEEGKVGLSNCCLPQTKGGS